jgi:hypothetical protein
VVPVRRRVAAHDGEAGALLGRLPLSSAMVYLALGWLLGPDGTNLLRPDPVAHAAVLARLAEGALLISLFAVGLRLGVPLRDRRWWLPLRLAILSMEAMVAMISAIGVWWLDLPLGAAVPLGAILAPTDPVLASGVPADPGLRPDLCRLQTTTLCSTAYRAHCHSTLTRQGFASVQTEPRPVVTKTPQRSISVSRRAVRASCSTTFDRTDMDQHREHPSAPQRAGSQAGVPAESTAAELAQLRIRVIALENLVITLLSALSDRQRGLARDMAAYILPRPGFTDHRPTTHAAAQMIHMVERADHFRSSAVSTGGA